MFPPICDFAAPGEPYRIPKNNIVRDATRLTLFKTPSFCYNFRIPLRYFFGENAMSATSKKSPLLTYDVLEHILKQPGLDWKTIWRQVVWKFLLGLCEFTIAFAHFLLPCRIRSTNRLFKQVCDRVFPLSMIKTHVQRRGRPYSYKCPHELEVDAPPLIHIIAKDQTGTRHAYLAPTSYNSEKDALVFKPVVFCLGKKSNTCDRCPKDIEPNDVSRWNGGLFEEDQDQDQGHKTDGRITLCARAQSEYTSSTTHWTFEGSRAFGHASELPMEQGLRSMRRAYINFKDPDNVEKWSSQTCTAVHRNLDYVSKKCR